MKTRFIYHLISRTWQPIQDEVLEFVRRFGGDIIPDSQAVCLDRAIPSNELQTFVEFTKFRVEVHVVDRLRSFSDWLASLADEYPEASMKDLFESYSKELSFFN